MESSPRPIRISSGWQRLLAPTLILSGEDGTAVVREIGTGYEVRRIRPGDIKGSDVGRQFYELVTGHMFETNQSPS